MATPPYYREMMEENGIDMSEAFYLTAEGITHEAQHKYINARTINRLLTIDGKSAQLLATSERQWKLVFSYVPPLIPCEIIVSFYAKFPPLSRQLK